MLSFGITLLLALATPQAPTSDLNNNREGPIEFTCDSMKITTNPNRSICQNNVVVRRGDLLVCCTHFTGNAQNDWSWDAFTCNGNVVAQRANELMWADNALFDLQSSDLVLTGKPLLQRANSHLTGTKITLNIQNDQADIVKPRGVFYSTPTPNTSARITALKGPVPNKCPLPPRPQR